jgi:hypothetical protein
MPRPVQYQARLLFRMLDGHEAHAGPLYGLKDWLRISSDILLRFDIRFYIGRRQTFTLCPAVVTQ